MIQQVDRPDSINTSEAYSKLGFMISDCLVIPYVNIQLLPSNPLSEKACFVNYSYFVFKGLVEITDDRGWKQVFTEGKKWASKLEIDEDILVGSWQDRVGVQLNIKCVSAKLYLGIDYAIDSSRRFIPFDTPNFKQNLSKDKVDSFFEYENILQRFKNEL